MTLEQQVCSLELAKRLKELGVRQESEFHWRITNASYETTLPGGPYLLDKSYLPYYDKMITAYSAFTVAELGEMLPQILKLGRKKYQLFVSVALDKQWFVVYANEVDYADNAPIKFMMCHNEADARAKMLVYLLENKLVTKDN